MSYYCASCHFSCAFANTPKYNQVKGKGKIVTKLYILDSYRKKIRLPWQRSVGHRQSSKGQVQSGQRKREDRDETIYSGLVQEEDQVTLAKVSRS